MPCDQWSSACANASRNRAEATGTAALTQMGGGGGGIKVFSHLQRSSTTRLYQRCPNACTHSKWPIAEAGPHASILKCQAITLVQDDGDRGAPATAVCNNSSSPPGKIDQGQALQLFGCCSCQTPEQVLMHPGWQIPGGCCPCQKLGWPAQTGANKLSLSEVIAKFQALAKSHDLKLRTLRAAAAWIETSLLRSFSARS